MGLHAAPSIRNGGKEGKRVKEGVCVECVDGGEKGACLCVWGAEHVRVCLLGLYGVLGVGFFDRDRWVGGRGGGDSRATNSERTGG